MNSNILIIFVRIAANDIIGFDYMQLPLLNLLLLTRLLSRKLFELSSLNLKILQALIHAFTVITRITSYILFTRVLRTGDLSLF